MVSATWFPFRRDDGELLGWIRPEGELWVAVALLGRDVSDPLEWLDAEDVLTDLGLSWLAEAAPPALRPRREEDPIDFPPGLS